MRRLYVELAVPDDFADAHPLDLALSMLADTDAVVQRARWYPMGFDVPNTLTHVGWLNPDSGALHRNKMDLEPGDDWVRLYMYDPAQFAQVDGGVHCATLADALEQATYKVTFMLHTGEQVRLVREEVDCCAGETAFVLRPFVDELRAALVDKGVPADAAASLAGMVTGWEQDVIDRAPEGAVAEETMPLDDT